MRRASILFSVFAFCTAGLIAQNADLAQYQTWMKTGVAAQRAMMAGVTAKDAGAIKENSAKGAEAFDSIAKYWGTKQKPDAVKFAEDARDASKAVAEATDEAGQQAALGKLQGTCRGCHTVYRNGSEFKQ
ncbi:MAG: hypothetical protein JWN34_5259 [Bryobacterales bacterium]|nr:hypothetical protein [Bryobacterales bacterium]